MAGPKAITQYERVRERVEAGARVGDAIKEMAQELGVSVNTLHTTYYRVLKETSPSQRVRVGSGNGNGDVDSLTREALSALMALAEHAESLEKKADQLQRIQETLARVS